MCDRRIDPSTWKQYNPYLQNYWGQQFDQYQTNTAKPAPPVKSSENCHLTRQWEMHHPELQLQWKQQIQSYGVVSQVPTTQSNQNQHVNQMGGKWKDPFENLGFWKIVDFFREFEWTR